MKHIYEFNVFNNVPDESRENEILSDIASLFCDKIDKFLIYDPDWKRLSDEDKINFIDEVYDLFINKYYPEDELRPPVYEEDYAEELKLLLTNGKDEIIKNIIEEIEDRFHPNMPT